MNGGCENFWFNWIVDLFGNLLLNYIDNINCFGKVGEWVIKLIWN